MTPDGISDADWDRIHELAVEIVNTSESEEGKVHTAALLEHLDRLEERYGPLPSILATRADYVEDPQESLELLERAYPLAVERRDHKNVLYIASSLASLHIEKLRNADEGGKWLAALKEALKNAGGEWDIKESDDLATALETLRLVEDKAGKP
ncbi:MAG TPA: hypothetical protein VFD71_21050 [Planctomycetota bacterium]|nr:hypothetical protein [Planctomycetota bacterium]